MHPSLIGVVFFIASLAHATESVPVNGATAAVAPSPSPATETKDVTPAELVQRMRDPFQIPFIETRDKTVRTELETMPIDQFRVLAIVTGPGPVRAMMMGPNNKVYIVGENTKIGIRKGFIKKIRKTTLEVQERIINEMGHEENVVSELKMNPDAAAGMTAKSQ